MRFLVMVVLMINTLSFGQTFEMSSLIKEVKNGTVNGIVIDNKVDNESLAFASITVKETNDTITTKLDGSFSISLKPGSYTLEFSFIGYKSIIVNNVLIESNKVTTINQKLKALTINALSVISEIEK